MTKTNAFIELTSINDETAASDTIGAVICSGIGGHHMDRDHPNIQAMKQLNLGDLTAAKDLFAEDVVWHYFNPNLPELQGDYVGLTGIRSFFQSIGGKNAWDVQGRADFNHRCGR